MIINNHAHGKECDKREREREITKINQEHTYREEKENINDG
jgi:hypothetical protein